MVKITISYVVQESRCRVLCYRNVKRKYSIIQKAHVNVSFNYRLDQKSGILVAMLS